MIKGFSVMFKPRFVTVFTDILQALIGAREILLDRNGTSNSAALRIPSVTKSWGT